MNTDRYEIEPTERVTTKVITNFEVKILDIRLFKSCILGVTFYTSDNQFVEYKAFELIGDDYSNWSADDDYIIQYVKSKGNSSFPFKPIL